MLSAPFTKKAKRRAVGVEKFPPPAQEKSAECFYFVYSSLKNGGFLSIIISNANKRASMVVKPSNIFIYCQKKGAGSSKQRETNMPSTRNRKICKKEKAKKKGG